MLALRALPKGGQIRPNMGNRTVASSAEMAEIGRRIKAAQALGGYPSVKALAQAITTVKDFGDKTINRVIYGQRTLEPHEAQAIADACGIHVDFFTADLSKLSAHPAPTDNEIINAVNAKIAEHDQHMAEAVELLMTQISQVRLAERLAAIEDAVLGVRGDELALRDAGRAVTGRLADQLGDGAQDDQAAGGTQSDADANQGSARARREGKQSS